MTEQIIHLQAHIDGVQTRKDRSVKIVLVSGTEVTNPNELARLFSLTDHPVSVGMKVGRLSDDDMMEIPEPEEDYRHEKSPGQRLRAVLYRWWEAKGRPNDFELFYKRNMEHLIEQIKDKL